MTLHYIVFGITYYAMLHSIILYYAVVCYNTLDHAILYYFIPVTRPYYATLYHVILH